MDKQKDEHRIMVGAMVLVGAATGAAVMLAKSAGPAFFGWLLDLGLNVGGPGAAGGVGAGGPAQCPPGTHPETFPPGIPWPSSGPLGCPVDPDDNTINHDHPARTPGGPVCMPDSPPYHPDPDGGWDGYYGDQPYPRTSDLPPNQGPSSSPQTWGEKFDDMASQTIDKIRDPNSYK